MRKYILPILILLAISLFAQLPSTADYTLTFSTFSNGGTELPAQRTSSRFMLSDVVGRGTSAADEVLSGTTYNLYGGFRNVDLDLREPFAWVDADDFIQPAASFPISWSAADTTIEDGEGWGIWKYDVQWSKETDPGTWHDWHIETELTFATFGPTDPDAVGADEKYYFRVRAYDLVNNVYAWGSTAVEASIDSCKFQPPTVDYTVRTSTGDSIWAPVTGTGLVDTLELDEAVAMRTGEHFIVDNDGTDPIDIGLYSFNATPWELADTNGRDAYALRAIMNDATVPPLDADYQPVTNAIPKGSENVRYADADSFGTGGFNLDAEGGADDTENLWLQIQAPQSVTRFGHTDNVEINIRVEARNTIY